MNSGSNQNGGVLKGPVEIMGFGIAGLVLGAGLASRFYGQPLLGEATFGAIGGTIAGGFIPIPYVGGFIGAAVAVHYLVDLPYMDGAVIALASSLGLMAGAMVGATIFEKKLF